LGDTEQAFAWWKKCVELRSGKMTWLYLGNFPWLMTVRADPRFPEINRKMAVPP
jgi:hypothetical protein